MLLPPAVQGRPVIHDASAWAPALASSTVNNARGERNDYQPWDDKDRDDAEEGADRCQPLINTDLADGELLM